MGIETLKGVNIIDIKAGGYHNVAMSEEFEFFIWGANNKYACLTGNTTNLKIPTKFDVNACAEISNEIVLAIWPGYHSSRVIVSRTKTKPVLGVSVKSTIESKQSDNDEKAKKDPVVKKKKITDPVELKKIAKENYIKEMLKRKQNKEWSEWFVHLKKNVRINRCKFMQWHGRKIKMKS